MIGLEDAADGGFEVEEVCRELSLEAFIEVKGGVGNTQFSASEFSKQALCRVSPTTSNGTTKYLQSSNM